MARAVTKYVFAALFALLSTQAVVPSVRVAPGIEIVCGTGVEQQIPNKTVRLVVRLRARPAVPCYISHTRPEPDAPILFQRPPPHLSVFV